MPGDMGQPAPEDADAGPAAVSSESVPAVPVAAAPPAADVVDDLDTFEAAWYDESEESPGLSETVTEGNDQDGIDDETIQPVTIPQSPSSVIDAPGWPGPGELGAIHDYDGVNPYAGVSAGERTEDSTSQAVADEIDEDFDPATGWGDDDAVPTEWSTPDSEEGIPTVPDATATDADDDLPGWSPSEWSALDDGANGTGMPIDEQPTMPISIDELFDGTTAWSEARADEPAVAWEPAEIGDIASEPADAPEVAWDPATLDEPTDLTVEGWSEDLVEVDAPVAWSPPEETWVDSTLPPVEATDDESVFPPAHEVPAATPDSAMPTPFQLPTAADAPEPPSPLRPDPTADRPATDKAVKRLEKRLAAAEAELARVAKRTSGKKGDLRKAGKGAIEKEVRRAIGDPKLARHFDVVVRKGSLAFERRMVPPVSVDADSAASMGSELLVALEEPLRASLLAHLLADYAQAEANRRVAAVLGAHGAVSQNGDFDGLVRRLSAVSQGPLLGIEPSDEPVDAASR